MSQHNKPRPEMIDVEIPGTTQTIIDILSSQYERLDIGEARAQLETVVEDVWSAVEFEQLFNAANVRAPYVDVVRKTDGTAGTVMFIDAPRLYFSFNAESTPLT